MPRTLEELQAAVNSGQISAEEAAKLASGQTPGAAEPAPKATAAPTFEELAANGNLSEEQIGAILSGQNAPANKLIAKPAASVSSQTTQSAPAQATPSNGLQSGQTIFDIADMRYGDVKRLNRLGFLYTKNGQVTRADQNALISRKDWRDARRRQRFARRTGYIGDTSGMDQDTINLLRMQYFNDTPSTYILPPAQQATQSAPAEEAPRQWNFSGQIDENWKDQTQNLLQALADNGHYDILDAMSASKGVLTADSLKRWQMGLGVGDEFKSGHYGKGSIEALLSRGLINQEQANRLLNGIPEEVVEAAAEQQAAPAARPQAVVSTPTDWIAAAKNAGFGVGLDASLTNYNDILTNRVKSWQKANGLVDDGKFGNLSRAKLGNGTFVTNNFDANGNYIAMGANGQPNYSVVAGRQGTVSTKKLPDEWKKAGVRNVQFTWTKPGGMTGAGEGYYTLTDEQAKQINDYWAQAHKQGGRIMKYFQAGGAVNAQQVAQEQAQQQEAQLTEMFMALAKNPKETLMALQKQGVQPKQVIELAQKMADKNPAAKQALAALSQMSQMAKQGAKLAYIKRLRGECPEGYEARTYKIGGKVCKKCEKIEVEKCGGKAKKHQNGGEAQLVTDFKNRKKN
jgi:hypothetical protein